MQRYLHSSSTTCFHHSPFSFLHDWSIASGCHPFHHCIKHAVVAVTCHPSFFGHHLYAFPSCFSSLPPPPSPPSPNTSITSTGIKRHPPQHHPLIKKLVSLIKFWQGGCGERAFPYYGTGISAGGRAGHCVSFLFPFLFTSFLLETQRRGGEEARRGKVSRT